MANVIWIPGVWCFEQENARVKHMDKNDWEINDENYYHPILVVRHIAKRIEALVSYQIFDLLKEYSFILMDQSAYL